MAALNVDSPRGVQLSDAVATAPRPRPFDAHLLTGDEWLLDLPRPVVERGVTRGKRAFDLVVALVALVVAMPLLLVTALAIWLTDRGPVFYRQARVGFGGRTFRVLKFRSMVPDAEARQAELAALDVTDGLLFKIDGDPRVTPVGRIIRWLSIDELPQLWNVVKGEMSLVGPRPLAVSPDSFTVLEHRRHVVLPGITGLWQVSGDNSLSYAEMISLDLTYVRQRTFGTDLKLLALTVPTLVRRCGPA